MMNTPQAEGNTSFPVISPTAGDRIPFPSTTNMNEIKHLREVRSLETPNRKGSDPQIDQMLSKDSPNPNL